MTDVAVPHVFITYHLLSTNRDKSLFPDTNHFKVAISDKFPISSHVMSLGSLNFQPSQFLVEKTWSILYFDEGVPRFEINNIRDDSIRRFKVSVGAKQESSGFIRGGDERHSGRVGGVSKKKSIVSINPDQQDEVEVVLPSYLNMIVKASRCMFNGKEGWVVETAYDHGLEMARFYADRLDTPIRLIGAQTNLETPIVLIPGSTFIFDSRKMSPNEFFLFNDGFADADIFPQASYDCGGENSPFTNSLSHGTSDTNGNDGNNGPSVEEEEGQNTLPLRFGYINAPPLPNMSSLADALTQGFALKKYPNISVSFDTRLERFVIENSRSDQSVSIEAPSDRPSLSSKMGFSPGMLQESRSKDTGAYQTQKREGMFGIYDMLSSIRLTAGNLSPADLAKDINFQLNRFHFLTPQRLVFRSPGGKQLIAVIDSGKYPSAHDLAKAVGDALNETEGTKEYTVIVHSEMEHETDVVTSFEIGRLDRLQFDLLWGAPESTYLASVMGYKPYNLSGKSTYQSSTEIYLPIFHGMTSMTDVGLDTIYDDQANCAANANTLSRHDYVITNDPKTNTFAFNASHPTSVSAKLEMTASPHGESEGAVEHTEDVEMAVPEPVTFSTTPAHGLKIGDVVRVSAPPSSTYFGVVTSVSNANSVTIDFGSQILDSADDEKDGKNNEKEEDQVEKLKKMNWVISVDHGHSPNFSMHFGYENYDPKTRSSLQPLPARMLGFDGMTVGGTLPLISSQQQSAQPNDFVLIVIRNPHNSSYQHYEYQGSLLGNVFATIHVNDANLKVERTVSNQVFFSGIQRIRELEVELLNPDLTRYQTHGKDWSMTLIFETPQSTPNIGCY